MLQPFTLICLASVAAAAITIVDPSDIINPADWTTDNALLADYNIEPTLYQTQAILGPYSYSGQELEITRANLRTSMNDTSVLVISNRSHVMLSHTDIVKFGYCSNLYQASFYGLNAAVNIANGSVLHATHINVTVHNGAAGIYSYGRGTEVYVDNAWLYSSGPTSHGLYASGNGSIYAKDVRHYSGGNRCSSFSGDNPAGYIHVTDAIAHTDGIGSAICYALGLCNMTNVVGHASRSPVTFSDGPQTTIWKNSDLTAGLLGGVVLFSSQSRVSGATVTFDNSRLTVLGNTMPSIWIGNLIGTAKVISSQLNNSASGLLAVANYSQVTQDFDYYADFSDNNLLSPAELTLVVEDSHVSGDLVAYNQSRISLHISQYSSWSGMAYSGFGVAHFEISIDGTSTWDLAGTTYLQNFTDSDTSLSNIKSNGFDIEYNETSAGNIGWRGRSYPLPGGGRLCPRQ